MARKLRLEFAGACYHVLNRGNYRKCLFASKGAAESFRTCLFEACTRFQWRLHAFVIMRNHFHLAVETPEPNLSDGMKWLQGTWAARFNRFRGEAGRPFQGRYKALHVEPGHALGQVAHYIHLNPVRAKIVPAEAVSSYPWSSLSILASKPRPPFLEAATVLRESGNLPDTAAGWRSYREYLAVLHEEGARQRDQKFGRLSRGWIIGSAEFKTGLKRELLELAAGANRFELLGADRDAHREAREASWEEALRAAARLLHVSLERLPPAKSARDKIRLAALMKTTTSVSNPWLAARLGMGQPGCVSQYVRRFRLRGEANERHFRIALSKVHT